MKPVAYFTVLLLAVVCVVLSVALVLISQTNQELQLKLQAQQQALSQGILGQQAQQISGGVIQDLIKAAGTNREISQLLEKHGYSVPGSRSTGAAVSASKSKEKESTKPEASNP
ncbi:MAG: hypothetical protein WCN95_02440 [bacterium]